MESEISKIFVIDKSMTSILIQPEGLFLISQTTYQIMDEHRYLYITFVI